MLLSKLVEMLQANLDIEDTEVVLEIKEEYVSPLYREYKTVHGIVFHRELTFKDTLDDIEITKPNVIEIY